MPAFCYPELLVSWSPATLATEAHRRADRWIGQRGGWARILRNTAVGYVQQAGGRMAAALAYYSILVGAPLLIVALLLGQQLVGEDATRAAVTQMMQGTLPPGAGGAADFAAQLVEVSTPTAGVALLAGVVALLQYTRLLATSLNVSFNAEGVEPARRTFIVGPILLMAVVGLLWGTVAFRLLAELVQQGAGSDLSRLAEVLIGWLAPLVLAAVFFAIILAVVPRVRLTWREVLVPSVIGAVLWEAARHLFAAIVGSQDVYVWAFGSVGGFLALLGWAYLNSVILLVVGQLAWAHAMECRGRGHLATEAPRQAGPEGWAHPFEGDNVVNEDQAG